VGRILRLCLIVLVFTAASGEAAEPSRPEPFLVGIVLDAPTPWVEGHAAAMIGEADAIWRPHGVALIRVLQETSAVDARITVNSNLRRRSATARLRNGVNGGDGLGAISFDGKGRPARLIALDPDAIVATVRQALVNGRGLPEWPLAFTDLVVARALGRVLAHEVGHLLLAYPAHTRDGLMRSGFDGRQLAYVDRRSFALSASLMPRLRHQLAQLQSEQQSARATRQLTP
jgi:hypothetical protein